MKKIASLSLSTLLSAALLSTAALAQSAPVSPLKFTKWIITVTDLEKSIAFYHDAFGFEMNPNTQLRPLGAANAGILKLTNSPEGTMFRNSTIRSAALDWNLEITEFHTPDGKPAAMRLQDPGTTYLRLRVRDIDAAVAGALKHGGAVNSVGGKVMTAGKNKVVMLKDPDGHFIEVTQPGEIAADAPAGQLLAGNFVAVVADADKAANFYKAQLGLENQIVGWNTNETTMNMFGTPGAQMHRASIFVPGTKLQLEFIQFKGIDTKGYNLRVSDQGSAQLGLQVPDLDAAVAAFTANGGSTETQGGEVKRATGGGQSFVRDMNGFLVELTQVSPPAPK
jgi:catechol 2,3-dioxygenase-like lactoylglutathione lyase family enzyme